MANERRLIDANRALEIVRDQGHEHPNAYHLTNYATLILREAPTVDAVEVVHGRWIHDCVEGCNPFVDSLPIWVDVMQCSVCKEYIEGSHGTNYCPNCGAKMDGDGNG